MQGKTILFVGTKKQAQESIESEAKSCNMYYVNNRWLGGMLTNFRTIPVSYTHLQHLSFAVTNEASGKEILHDITLTVDSGRFVVITGPNGGRSEEHTSELQSQR